jgi:hypothetical protein|tara:strand:+ start:1261 stop:1500 length:240 start_codon:yes stop_codon:yes gene_type:complete
MRILYSLLFFILISCGSSSYNCGKIDRKFEKDGQYFFALILDDAHGSSDTDSGRIYGDVSVDKTTYLLKKVGDEYCVDE